MDTEKASFSQGQSQHLSVIDLIVWGERYSVGHPEIDEQHKNIFNLGISVYENWLKGGKADELRLLVEKLETLLKKHFFYEERLLTKISYEGLNEHIVEHRSMLKNLDAVKEQINERVSLIEEGGKSSGGSMLAADWPVLQFILGFTVGHVATSDMRYRGAITDSNSPD